MARVEIKGLTKSYGEHEVLRDLNIEVGEGEFLTLLGPSGCGKTTTLRCVAGLERADGSWLTPYTPVTVASSSDLAPASVGPDNEFYGASTAVSGVVTNSTSSLPVPKQWSDLENSVYKGKIAMSDPTAIAIMADTAPRSRSPCSTPTTTTPASTTASSRARPTRWPPSCTRAGCSPRTPRRPSPPRARSRP